MSSTDTSPSVARLPFREPAIAVAHFIVSADVERSRRFYTEVLGGWPFEPQKNGVDHEGEAEERATGIRDALLSPASALFYPTGTRTQAKEPGRTCRLVPRSLTAARPHQRATRKTPRRSRA